MRSHVLAPFSAAPEPAKRYVQPHTAGSVDLRVFFSDICAWSTEPDSPFKRFSPRTIPVTRHTFVGYGFEKARERTRARITATVLDLEREMPKIRAFALQHWKAAVAAPKLATTRRYPWSDEVDTFWDWALLELLVQSGLRIEEASELTTFDILKRKMPDSRNLLSPAHQAVEV